MVMDHNSCSLHRVVGVSPVVGVEIIVTKREFSFVWDFGFSNTSYGDIVVDTIVLPNLSFGGSVEASHIMGSNGKV